MAARTPLLRLNGVRAGILVVIAVAVVLGFVLHLGVFGVFVRALLVLGLLALGASYLLGKPFRRK